MVLSYSREMSKVLTSARKIKKEYGELADSIITKLAQISKVSDSSNLWNVPGNWHELKYNVKGVYSVTLKHPFRLIVRLDENKLGVCILDVINYHDNPTKIIARYN